MSVWAILFPLFQPRRVRYAFYFIISSHEKKYKLVKLLQNSSYSSQKIYSEDNRSWDNATQKSDQIKPLFQQDTSSVARPPPRLQNKQAWIAIDPFRPFLIKFKSRARPHARTEENVSWHSKSVVTPARILITPWVKNLKSFSSKQHKKQGCGCTDKFTDTERIPPANRIYWNPVLHQRWTAG